MVLGIKFYDYQEELQECRNDKGHKKAKIPNHDVQSHQRLVLGKGVCGRLAGKYLSPKQHVQGELWDCTNHRTKHHKSKGNAPLKWLEEPEYLFRFKGAHDDRNRNYRVYQRIFEQFAKRIKSSPLWQPWKYDLPIQHDVYDSISYYEIRTNY